MYRLKVNDKITDIELPVTKDCCPIIDPLSASVCKKGLPLLAVKYAFPMF